MEYHASIGPGCGDVETLSAMLKAGMTAARINLTHGTLADRAEWIENLREAEKRTGLHAQLLIDLQGPEICVGALAEPVELQDGETILLGEGGIPVPAQVVEGVPVGEPIQLDDGLMLVEVTEKLPGALQCKVIRGGTLASRKSLCPLETELEMPALTEADMVNLGMAKEYGVEIVMLPFVRKRQNLIDLRAAMDAAGLENARLFAKLEDMRCVEALPTLLDVADTIVIARGDLGNSMPLWELPRVQKEISKTCVAAGVPFLLVNQLLYNMTNHPIPTRTEVSDIFNAVLDGCTALMLVGETVNGKYPAEAVDVLRRTAEQALAYRAEMQA